MYFDLCELTPLHVLSPNDSRSCGELEDISALTQDMNIVGQWGNTN